MIIFWKLLAELALFFSFITAVPFFFTIGFNPVYIILLCLLAVAISEPACRTGRTGLRFAGLIPALAASVFIRSLTDAVIILPALLYTILIIVTKLKQPNYYSAVKMFKIACRIMGFATLLLLGIDYMLQFVTDNANITGKQAEFKMFDYVSLLICEAVFLFAETVMLRKLRVNTPVSIKKSAENTGRYLAGAIECGLIFSALFALFCLIMEMINRIYLKMHGVGLRMPAFIGNFLMAVRKWLFDGLKSTQPLGPTGPVPTSSPLPTYLPTDSGIVTVSPAPIEETAPSSTLWPIIIIIILLTCVLLIFFLHSRKNTIYKEPEQPDESAVRRAPSVSVFGNFSNREKVRKVYRSFMKYAKKHGYVIQPSDTTLDIMAGTRDFANGTPVETLRNIYLQTRYSSEAEITDEMVREAQNALNSIVNGAPEDKTIRQKVLMANPKN